MGRWTKRRVRLNGRRLSGRRRRSSGPSETTRVPLAIPDTIAVFPSSIVSVTFCVAIVSFFPTTRTESRLSSMNAVTGTAIPRDGGRRTLADHGHPGAQAITGIWKTDLHLEIGRARIDLIEDARDRAGQRALLQVARDDGRGGARLMSATCAPEPRTIAYVGSVCCNVKICRVPGYSPTLRFRFTTTPSIGETITAFAICVRTCCAVASATCSVARACSIVDDCRPAVSSVPFATTCSRSLGEGRRGRCARPDDRSRRARPASRPAVPRRSRSRAAAGTARGRANLWRASPARSAPSLCAPRAA